MDRLKHYVFAAAGRPRLIAVVLSVLLASVLPSVSSAQTNLGLATSGTSDVRLDGDLIATIVSESNQGNTDLNGDGDSSDRVPHLFDATTGTTTNLTLASGSSIELDGDLLAFTVKESEQGPAPGTDLNGDGEYKKY